MSVHARPCPVMPGHVKLCQVMSGHARSCLVMHARSFQVMSGLVRSCQAKSCQAGSGHVVTGKVMSWSGQVMIGHDRSCQGHVRTCQVIFMSRWVTANVISMHAWLSWLKAQNCCKRIKINFQIWGFEPIGRRVEVWVVSRQSPTTPQTIPN